MEIIIKNMHVKKIAKFMMLLLSVCFIADVYAARLPENPADALKRPRTDDEDAPQDTGATEVKTKGRYVRARTGVHRSSGDDEREKEGKPEEKPEIVAEVAEAEDVSAKREGKEEKRPNPNDITQSKPQTGSLDEDEDLATALKQSVDYPILTSLTSPLAPGSAFLHRGSSGQASSSSSSSSLDTGLMVNFEARNGMTVSIPFAWFQGAKVFASMKSFHSLRDKEKSTESLSEAEQAEALPGFVGKTWSMQALNALKIALDVLQKAKSLDQRNQIREAIPALSRLELTVQEFRELFNLANILQMQQMQQIKLLCVMAAMKQPEVMQELSFVTPEQLLGEEFSAMLEREKNYSDKDFIGSKSDHFENLVDHCFFPTVCDFSKIDLIRIFTRIKEDGAKILWEKLQNVKEVEKIVAQMPRSLLKDYLIERIIETTCINADANFMFWYNQLTQVREWTGNKRSASTARSRAIDIMKKQAHKLVCADNTDEDLAKIADKSELKRKVQVVFATMPEGLLKMYTREVYCQVHKVNIPESLDEKIQPLDINKIIARINDDNGYVNLSRLGLTTMAGIEELLVLRNEISPIKRLNLSHNQLTAFTIPEALEMLERLDLSHNQLTAFTIPEALKMLEQLDLGYNQLVAIIIPKELINLDLLNLRHNRLVAIKIPKELTKLDILYLDGNQLSSKQSKNLSDRFNGELYVFEI